MNCGNCGAAMKETKKAGEGRGNYGKTKVDFLSALWMHFCS
jgi:hypothetical protein